MNINNINILQEAYTALRTLALVRTKAEYSSKILGKGASYLTSMAARGREPPNEVLIVLMRRLVMLEDCFRNNADASSKDCKADFSAYICRLHALRCYLEASVAVRAAFATPDNVIPFCVRR